jgi:hypothetical protein
MGEQKQMKISEIISSLQGCKEIYGDIEVTLDFDDRKEIAEQNLIFISANIQNDKPTIIQIQNYPY